jgi:hypothetical protein
VALTGTSDEALRRARSLLGFGAVGVTTGIALSATALRTPGALVLLAGWLLLIAGIHAFGRLGSEG